MYVLKEKILHLRKKQLFKKKNNYKNFLEVAWFKEKNLKTNNIHPEPIWYQFYGSYF